MMGNNDNGYRVTIIIINSWLKDCGHLVNLHSKILSKNCKTVNLLIVFSISLNIYIQKKHVICIKQMVFNRKSLLLSLYYYGQKWKFESWLHVGDKLQTPFLLTFLLKRVNYFTVHCVVADFRDLKVLIWWESGVTIVLDPTFSLSLLRLVRNRI